VDVGDEADGAAVSLAEGQRAGSQYTTTLKKECPTRWNSLLTMMESLLKSRQLVERCLASLRLFDKITSVEARLADYSGLGELSSGFQESHRATQRFAISHVQHGASVQVRISQCTGSMHQ
jgi:hypothetical protein